MDSLCVKHLSIEVTKHAADAVIAHPHICNVLKYIRYIQRFDMLGAEQEPANKTVRYILKQLGRFGICVDEFRVIPEKVPGSGSKALSGICTALLAYQQTRQRPHEETSMGESQPTDSNGEDEVTALIYGHTRIIIQFRNEQQQSFPKYPLCLMQDNHLYGDLFLNAEGMIIGTCGQALCPANRFKHYLNSASKKKTAEDNTPKAQLPKRKKRASRKLSREQ